MGSNGKLNLCCINNEILCTLEDPWCQDVLGFFLCHYALIPIHVSGKTVCQQTNSQPRMLEIKMLEFFIENKCCLRRKLSLQFSLPK